MTRAKTGNSSRGRPISLPAWWLRALNARCGSMSGPQIAARLNEVAKRQPPWRVEAVYDFLSGKVTTEPMMGAFLVMFPDLPPPIFVAMSEEEARRFQQLAQIFQPARDEPTQVAETIEDTGVKRAREKARDSEKTRTGENTRTGEKSRKRTAK